MLALTYMVKADRLVSADLHRQCCINTTVMQGAMLHHYRAMLYLYNSLVYVVSTQHLQQSYSVVFMQQLADVG
jgi:hypothetical protein